MNTFIILPIIFLILGLTFAIYPKQSGTIFCRLGKLNWKIITLGITDMHWFYNEKNAPTTFRILGIVFSCFAILFLVISLLFGDGISATMNKASEYSERSKQELFECLNFDTLANYRIRERGSSFTSFSDRYYGYNSFVISEGWKNRYYRIEWYDSTKESYTLESIVETKWIENHILDTLFMRVDESTKITQE